MRGRAPAAALVLVAAAGLAGCGSGHHRGSSPHPPATVPTAPTPIPVSEISFGLAAPAPSNWNVLAVGNDTPALTAIADQVWPSVYDFGPSYAPVLDTALVTSAAATSSSLMTVVYRINPKAVWSDGTPITGTDFVYNWQVQADRSGYDQITSVNVSATDPDVVTVSFSTPDPDWQGLFSHLIPAHVAEHVGFASGFTDAVADLVSGGPYVVQSYDPGRSIRLVRNPSYVGLAPIATALDFDFLADPAQVSTVLATGQVTCAQVEATSAVLSPLEATHNLAVTVAPGSTYLDLDFKESDPALASASRRAAIAGAVNPAAVAAAVGGAAAGGVTAVANRFLVSGEPGYQPDGPTVAANPASVPHDSSVRLEAGADPLSAAVEKVVTSELRAAGISVTEVPAGSSSWDLSVEVRTRSPFPAAEAGQYLAGNGSDVDGFSSAAVSALVREAAVTGGSAGAALFDQIDQAAWSQHVDLPLVTVPVAVACQAGTTGVAPNPAPEGPAYDAAHWGTAAGGP